ncbi:MAG: ATP-dependent DNA helicase PcrA [Candidatus Dadabacteria bacterium]|nr:MAG: ATP-dependent DNA helicase PcrA [Candidatus Dadabacteria bacterium]
MKHLVVIYFLLCISVPFGAKKAIDFNATLNPEQLKGVKHFKGPILILAGAGSGKTRVLTHRIAYLISEYGVRPGNILAVTFTNKATDEMRERLVRMLGRDADKVWVSTFHSAGLRILRENAKKLGYTNDFTVYDAGDSLALIKLVLKELKIDPKKHSPKMFAAAIDSAKNAYINAQEFAKSAGSYEERLTADVYQAYQTRLLDSDAMDFGDLLVNSTRLLKEFPEVRERYQRQCRFVLVDEFQDTNLVQYMLVSLIVEKHKNIFVVGDDDQSIYAFRGADINNILNFEKDYPGTVVIKLEQNYRSTQVILDAANAIIKTNKSRKPKVLWTERKDGAPVYTFTGYDEDDEAEFVAQKILELCKDGRNYRDIAVFYRTNAQSRAIEEALMVHEIPYRIFGGLKFFERKEIKDILAYLRVLVNERDLQSFVRIINTPSRGIGPQTVKAILSLVSSKGVTPLEAARVVAKQKKAVGKFVELIDKLKENIDTSILSDLIRKISIESGYREVLEKSKDPVALSRLENIDELIAIGLEEPSGEDRTDVIRKFLDRVSLTASDQRPEEELKDQQADKEPDYVSLTTLHLAKGLEFPVVFLTGFEEGLLPHFRSIDEPGGIEEERRLCYVGFTRAMDELYLTRAQYRTVGRISGGGYTRSVSMFGWDIPAECLEHLSEGFFDSYLDDLYSDELDFPEFSETGQNLTRPKDITDSPYAGIKKDFLRSKKRKADKANILSTLKSADSLKSHERESKYREILKPGALVKHPSFGEGVIKEIEGDLNGDLRRVRVKVFFDRLDKTTKLIARYCKLEAVE